MRSKLILSVSAVLLLLSSCTGQQHMVSPPPADNGATNATADDFYRDCLARIPKDATPGQRDLAERTCQRDLADRKTTGGGESASPDTQPETLHACLSRIPKDASEGQRMVAEQRCKQGRN
jgi:hypothetical protein